MDETAKRRDHFGAAEVAPKTHGIGKYELGGRRECTESADHSDARGLIDIQAIHLFGGDEDYLKGDGLAANLPGQIFTNLRTKLLGIVEAGYRLGGIQDDRRSGKWTDHCAAAGFIAAGDEGESATVGVPFKPPRALEILLVSDAGHTISASVAGLQE